MAIEMNNGRTFLHITECTFSNNQKTVCSKEYHCPHQFRSDNGGGLSVLISESRSEVIISDTVLINNTAPSGGGMFVFLADNTSEVQIVVSNCYILHNNANGTKMSSGGGIQLSFSFGETGFGNTLLLEQLNLTSNSALPYT